MKHTAAILCFASLPALNPARAQDEDFKAGTTSPCVNLDTQYVDLSLLGQFHLRDDASEHSYSFISQRFAFDMQPWLTLGANYTLLKSLQPGTTDDWRDHHRLELEITPKWKATADRTFEFRQRFEARWIEDRDAVNYRTRHRAPATLNLHGLGPLTAIFAGDELFYDYTLDCISENRVVPLGLTFTLHEKAQLSLACMLIFPAPASQRPRDEWQNTHAPITTLSLDF